MTIIVTKIERGEASVKYTTQVCTYDNNSANT